MGVSNGSYELSANAGLQRGSEGSVSVLMVPAHFDISFDLLSSGVDWLFFCKKTRQ